MNLHTPARGPDESPEAYRARRRRSHEWNALNGRPEGWKPEPRIPGSMAVSPPLHALLTGSPLPKLKKRASRKHAPA